MVVRALLRIKTMTYYRVKRWNADHAAAARLHEGDTVSLFFKENFSRASRAHG